MIALPIPKDQLSAFCEKWNVAEMSLFGSVVREDFRPDSDVDVMVSFAPGASRSLFDLSDMQDELAQLFGRPVDLLTRSSVERSINRARPDAILKPAVLLDIP